MGDVDDDYILFDCPGTIKIIIYWDLITVTTVLSIELHSQGSMGKCSVRASLSDFFY